MARSVILTAPQVVLYINGVLFGRVSSFRYNSDTARNVIGGVDSISPFELATTVSRVSGSMSIYRLTQDGAAEGAGMVATIPELSREKYFSIILVDITSSVVIFQANDCSVESQSWAIDARSIIQGSVAFSALSYSNEVRPLG